MFLGRVLPIFGLCLPESENVDLKFGFSAKNHTQNRILRSGIEVPGPNMVQLVFQYVVS